LLVVLLAACGGESGPRNLLETAQAPCPRVSILADAADLTRFRPGGGTDLAAMAFDARIAGFRARCDYAPRRAGLDVTLTLAFNAERGPAATGRSVDLPYVVAVVSADESRVLSRAAFATRAVFPPNVSRLQGQGEELSIRLPGTPQEAAAQAVLVGFALTPEELAVNRRRGVR
jgi:hypothetical protein